MNLFVFAIKDRASDSFMAPLFMAAPGQAIRMFTDEVNRAAEDNQLYKHPDDFDMYELGVFDTDTGNFDTWDAKVLVRGKDVAIRELH